MPLPKGQKNYANNPFNVHCISKGHSLVSASQAARMEEAWDCAINKVIEVSQQHKPDPKLVSKLRKLLSWEQRNS